MTIVTNCGHIVPTIDDVFDLQLKGYDHEGKRIVVYQCFCSKCADEKEINNEIIHNQQEESDWLNGISDEPKNTLVDYAVKLMHHHEKEVAFFAEKVYKFIELSNNDKKIVVVRVDTNDEFTLSLKDSLITGVGKVIFGSISEAIICLSSAHATWRKDSVVSYDTFLQYCIDAASALRNGSTSFIKQDSSFMLTIEVKK